MMWKSWCESFLFRRNEGWWSGGWGPGNRIQCEWELFRGWFGNLPGKLLRGSSGREVSRKLTLVEGGVVVDPPDGGEHWTRKLDVGKGTRQGLDGCRLAACFSRNVFRFFS